MISVFCVLQRNRQSPCCRAEICKGCGGKRIDRKCRNYYCRAATRGIDAGASELIRHKLVELRDQGAAVLLISADLNEILELSDSCIVMYNGKINAYFEDTTHLTEEELGYYMLGVKNQSEEEVRAML